MSIRLVGLAMLTLAIFLATVTVLTAVTLTPTGVIIFLSLAVLGLLVLLV